MGVQRTDLCQALEAAADTCQRAAATANRDTDLLICNAGFGLKGRHETEDPGKMSAMLNVNARAPMLIANALSPPLIARGKGGIIFTASIEGFQGFPYSARYAASKAYVCSLGEALWYELKPKGVDVLVLAPGSTDTEALSLQGFNPEDMAGLMPPRQIAMAALQQLGKKQVYIVGGLNAFFIRLLAALPRRWGVSLAGAGMRAALEKTRANSHY